MPLTRRSTAPDAGLLQWWPLFLISGLGLFLEMAAIRWMAAELRLFSYFKNLPLLAAFLGLSIGFALVRKDRDYAPRLHVWLGLFVGAVLVVGRTTSPAQLGYPSTGEEFLWDSGHAAYAQDLFLFLGTILLFFLLTMFLFIPLGQATGKEMARHDPVPAYCVNLAGSLVGVLLFALLSYLQTPPAVWFGLAMLGLGYYLASTRALTRPTVAVFLAVLVVLAISGRGIIWSPYHRLDVGEIRVLRESNGEPVQVGYRLRVNQVFYQIAVDLSEAFLAELQGDIPEMDDLAVSYNLPYRLGPESPRVLIVGAGMGNDAAAALRQGASHIDAVDIDPAILKLGRELHPESPYGDSRVTVIVDDARSFFQRSSERYDVISFGLLDSHTLLSSLSSVRLDSFVYTLESLAQAKGHLTENGVVVVTFGAQAAAEAPWLEERLGRMLAEVSGGAGSVLVHRGFLGTQFVAGPGLSDQAAQDELTDWVPAPEYADLPLPSDDWPYLYLRARRVPAAYWQALLLIGLACLAVIARHFREALRPTWHFWLLGAAFLLIEFKSITELALLFGTTWLVNVFAVSGVLLMALGANLVVLWRPRINLWLAYTLLFASLALAYVFPLDWLTGFAPVVRALMSVILLSLPLFFAGLIFGESLRLAGETTRPLASNLSGSVAGGILEYGSLLWGIKSLYVIATVVYAGALLAFLVQKRRR